MTAHLHNRRGAGTFRPRAAQKLHPLSSTTSLPLYPLYQLHQYRYLSSPASLSPRSLHPNTHTPQAHKMAATTSTDIAPRKRASSEDLLSDKVRPPRLLLPRPT